MPVKSRLKLLLSEKNTERIRAGQEPWKIRELAEAAELSPSVVSGLTTNRATQVRFDTLSKLCKVLDCTPGDILAYLPDGQKIIEEAVRAVSERAALERELMPCPFCGGTARLVIEGEIGHEYCFVLCPCGACGPGKATPAQAAQAWNVRTT